MYFLSSPALDISLSAKVLIECGLYVSSSVPLQPARSKSLLILWYAPFALRCLPSSPGNSHCEGSAWSSFACAPTSSLYCPIHLTTSLERNAYLLVLALVSPAWNLILTRPFSLLISRSVVRLETTSEMRHPVHAMRPSSALFLGCASSSIRLSSSGVGVFFVLVT